LPKGTFYNLPEKKQQILLQAAEQEFSRVPLPKASIANIIKSADIARGSFYQYFENKEDVFYFLLNKKTGARQLQFIESLHKYHGDLFEAVLDMFKLVLLELPPREENLHFLKNALLNMTHRIEESLADIFVAHRNHEKFEKISELIDKSNLNVSNDEEIVYIIRIIATITLHHLVEAFASKTSHNEALASFKKEMDFLKKGLAK